MRRPIQEELVTHLRHIQRRPQLDAEQQLGDDDAQTPNVTLDVVAGAEHAFRRHVPHIPVAQIPAIKVIKSEKSLRWPRAALTRLGIQRIRRHLSDGTFRS